MTDVEQKEISLLECSEQPGTFLEKVEKFDYSQISDVKSIESRKFMIVFSITFEGRKYALKSLNNNLQIDIKTIEQIKCEHENIVKLYGFSKDLLSHSFMLVLQLTNRRILQEYLEKKLQENIYKISWCELIKIANGTQIISFIET